MTSQQITPGPVVPASPKNLRWRRMILAMSVAAAGASLSPRHSAADITYTDFSDTTGLTLNGGASAVDSTFASGTPLDGYALQVIPSLPGEAGSAFTSDALNVSGGFDAYFTFRIGSQDTYGFNGADGFTFTIQNQSPGALGQGGGYLGLGGSSTIAPSVSVLFDIFQNDSSEPSDNYIGLVANGNVNNGVTHLANADLTGNSSVSLRDQQLVYTWIDYSGGVLSIYASEDGVKPAAALISQSIDLSSFTNSYVGFTAGSGSGTAAFDILNWDLNTSGSAYGNPPSAPFVDFHANGVDGSNWNSPTTWQEAAVPTIVNNVYLADSTFSSPYTLWVTDPEQAQSLHLTGSPGDEATLLITGGGAELDVAAAIEVQAGNTLTADSGGQFFGAPGARVSNAGTIQATNGGSVYFDANSYIDQTVGGAGLLLSDGPGSSISFGNNVVVHGGILRATDGGSIYGTGNYLTYDSLDYDAYLDVEANLTMIIHGPTTVTGTVLVEGPNALLSVQDGADLQVTPDGGNSWNTLTVQSDGLGNPGTFQVTGSTADVGTVNVTAGGWVNIFQQSAATSTLNVHGDLNVFSIGNLNLEDDNSYLNVDGTLSVDSSSYFTADQSTLSVGTLALAPGSNVSLTEVNLSITGSRFVLDPDDGDSAQVLADNGNPGILTVDGNPNDSFQLLQLHVDSGTFFVGDNTNGDPAQLNLVNGALVTAQNLEIGSNGSNATVNVQPGTSLYAFDTLKVDASGTLIANQASVSAGHLALDPAASITFTEVDFSLTNDDFYVDSSVGTAPQIFADNPALPGVITVDGNDADTHALHGLHVDNNTLYIGTVGSGTLSITNGGFVSAHDIFVGSQGTLKSLNGNITVQSLQGLMDSTGTLDIVESGFNLNGLDFVVDPVYGTFQSLFAEPGSASGTVIVDGNAAGTHVLKSLSVYNEATLYIGQGGGASTLNVVNGGSVFAQNSNIGSYGQPALLNINTGATAQMNNLYAGGSATLMVGTSGALIVSGTSTLDVGSVVSSQNSVYFEHTVGDSAIDLDGTLDSALIVVDVNDPAAGTNGGYVNFNDGAQIGQNMKGDVQVNSGRLTIWTQNTVNFNNIYVGEIVPDPNNPPQSILGVYLGTTANVQGQLVIGDALNSNGLLFLDGSGTVLSVGLDNMMIGDTIFARYGSAFGDITGGAKLSTTGTNDGYIGYEPSSNAYLIISGLDPNYPNGPSLSATWTIGGNLYIGNAAGANAQIDVSSAGLLDVTGDIHLGTNGNGHAILNVFGYDDNNTLPSTVHSGGDLIIGDSGNGFIILHIFGSTHNGDGGGQVQTDGNGYVGLGAGSNGDATVEDYNAATGLPSAWTINHDLYVGDSGTGQLNIGSSPDGSSANGGMVNVLGTVHLGSDYNSTGQINLWGINPATSLRATLQVGGDLLVGENGTGTINIGTNDSSITNYNPASPLLNLGGALVTVAGNLVLAGSSNSEVGIRFSDPNTGLPSTLDVTGTATLNNGVLSLYDGGLMNSGDASLGTDVGTSGTAWVSTNSTWNVHGTLYVGVLGGGYLSSWAGSNITTDGALFIGSNSDGIGDMGNGTVEVNNPGGNTPSVIAVGTFTEVGDFGTGVLNIGGNGILKSPFFAIAFGTGAMGTVNVIGQGAALTVADATDTPGTLYVGQGYLDSAYDEGTPGTNPLAYGYLYINSGGVVTDYDAHVGSDNLGVGYVQVATGGTWTSTSTLGVGERGTATVNIQSGGSVSSYGANIGFNRGGYGEVNVIGSDPITHAPSTFTVNNNNLDIGVGDDAGGTILSGTATGILNIQAGAQATTAAIILGVDPFGIGTIDIQDPGSVLNASAAIVVGQEGTGSLSITGGGFVSDVNAYIGRYAGATGVATVSGGGAHWSSAGSLFIAANDTLNNYENQTLAAGAGTLILGAGATVSAAISATIASAGLLTMQGGSFSAPATTLTGVINGYGNIFGPVSGSGAVTAAGPSPLVTDGLRVNSLTVTNSLMLRSDANPTGTTKVSRLLIAAATTGAFTGTLDITTDKLIVEATMNKASEIALLQSAVISGKNGVSWTGTGITSSTVASDVLTATTHTYHTVVAIVDNGAYPPGTSFSTYGGQPVDANSIIITRALAGDANLDGTVNNTDLVALLTHYGLAGQTQATGDYNGDGTVNNTDLVALLTDYGQSLPASFSLVPDATASIAAATIAPVPEPASLALLAMAAPLLLRRRRQPVRSSVRGIPARG